MSRAQFIFIVLFSVACVYAERFADFVFGGN